MRSQSYLYGVFLFLLCPVTLTAQARTKIVMDSLKKELYRNHDPHKSAILHYNISYTAFYESGDYVTAENYGMKAKQLAIDLKMDSVLIEVCEHLGNLKMSRGDYAGAIEQYQQGLRLVEQKDDKLRMSFLNNNIGINHWYQGNYDEALKYYKKSYKLSELLDDYEGMSGQLNNIGLIYRKKGDFKTALKYYESSLKLCERIKNDEGYANALNNIGIVKQFEKKYDEAIANYEQSLKIRRKLKDDIGISTSLGNLGSVYSELKDYSRAEPLFKEAYAISESVEDLEGIKELSYNLSDLYDKIGKPEQSYFYFRKFIASRDTLNDEDNKRQAYQKELNYQFETEKLKMEKEREKELVQKKEQERSQQIILVSVAGGSVLIIAFALYILAKFRQSKRQNKIIEQQKHLVEEKQKEIIDSITYAQRLQNAILAPESEIKKVLPESFLLYKPKDIVAGDFYFFETTDTHVFYAAADCTGHGVPGAMVSIVCSNALTRCVKEFGITDPGKILDKARELILETFQKSGEDVKDGMDISLVRFQISDYKMVNVQWAGANNPLWYIENNEMREITADKQPIGKTENPKPFTTHSLPISLSTLFLFTDGYADQFGGPKGKKFKYSSLQKILLDSAADELTKTKSKLLTTFDNWKGDLEQVDDVCIIGIKI